MSGHSRPAAARRAQSRSFASALLEQDSGSPVTRALRVRVLVVGAVVFVGLAVLRWWGEYEGFYGPGVGTAAFAAIALLTFVLLASSVARALERADGRRRRLEADYRRLVEQLPLVVYVDEIADNSANIYTSPQVEPLLGYTVEEWVGDPDLFVKVLHDEDRERVLAEVRKANTDGTPFVSEYRLIANDGRVVWIHDEAAYHHESDGEVVHSQGYMLDITRRRLAEEELRLLAVTDPLTSLPNRRQLIERLGSAARDGEAQSLLFVDIDDFKTFNDSLGHRTGDDLLVRLGERLRGCVQRHELVVRLGGDEFAISTPVTEQHELELLAQRVLDGLAAPLDVDARDLRVSASIGIATRGTPDELLRNADLAMYKAKSRGGNLFAFFAPELHEAAERRLRLSGDLRRPDLLDQLDVVYQPTFDLRHGCVEGVEALLRWRHPQLGLVPPAEFIPLAEEQGSIVEIGRFVLETACRVAAGWVRANGPLALAVNISGRQLREPSFVDDVAAALRDNGLDPSLLRLELTEGVLVHADDAARANVAAACESGVQLAIDDFGVGNSWIGHLEDVYADLIKVDRSLLSGVETGDPRLLRGTVALARELGARVVAEGVERPRQLEAVRRLGCDIGQGFLLARPMPAAEVAALLERELRPELLRARPA